MNNARQHIGGNMKISAIKSFASVLAGALLVTAVPAHSQVSAIIVGSYARQYRGANDQYVTDLAINNSSGEVFVVGTTATESNASGPISSVPSATASAFFSKVDFQGAVQWTKKIGRTGKSALDVSIARDAGGNYYMAVSDLTTTAQGAAYGIVVEKWSPAGVRFWQKALATTTRAINPTIAYGSESVYVAFSQADTPVGGRGGYDGVVVRLNALSGLSMSQAVFGSTSDDFANDVAVLTDGSVVLAGTTRGAFEGNRSSLRVDSDFFSIRYNAALSSVLVKRQWGSAFNDQLRAVAALSNSDFVVVGTSSGVMSGQANRGLFDGVVMRLNSAGSLQWTTTIGSNADDSVEDVAFSSSNGNIVVIGNTGGSVSGSAGNLDFFGATFNSAGVAVASKQMGTSQSDVGYALAVRSNGSPVFGGTTRGSLDGTNAVSQDGFVISAGVDVGSITQFVGTSNNLPIVTLPSLGVLIPASERAGAVGGVADPGNPPLCNEVAGSATKWRREIAVCGGLTVKRGTTTKIRLSLTNKSGVCSLTPRRRLKLTAVGTCKVRIRATQSNGSTKAVWITYTVS